MKLSPSWRRGEEPLHRGGRTVASLALLAALVASGCEYLAPPHVAWTEARAVGRVVDGDTHLPVEGAQISRALAAEPGAGATSVQQKGGPAMANRPAVAISDREGRFTLEAVKNAYLLLDSFPDYAVILRVHAPGYQSFQRLFTNVSYVGGDKKTMPIIETGEILVRREGGGGRGDRR